MTQWLVGGPDLSTQNAATTLTPNILSSDWSHPSPQQPKRSVASTAAAAPQDQPVSPSQKPNIPVAAPARESKSVTQPAEKYPEQRGAQCYRVHRERRVRPTPAEPDIASRCDRSGRSETSSIANGWPGSPRPDARCVRRRRGERIVYRGLVHVSKAAEANGIYPCNSVRQR